MRSVIILKESHRIYVEYVTSTAVYLSLTSRHGFVVLCCAVLCCAVLSGGVRTGAFRGLGVYIGGLALKLKLS